MAPKRLVARRYGRQQPLAKSRTAADRARNRRVAFRVLQPEPPPR